ncbi:hypothetical protein C1H76_3844 [Elsinoe australis]|uniref:WW domain-containing protein n=1 Tax=Elsinoe australis TaxID=40998 RepID=A0A4U7B560_9PEZI|nr:hypothetical protein C1H76_3844 [Elsinoe australis]
MAPFRWILKLCSPSSARVHDTDARGVGPTKRVSLSSRGSSATDLTLVDSKEDFDEKHTLQRKSSNDVEVVKENAAPKPEWDDILLPADTPWEWIVNDPRERIPWVAREKENELPPGWMAWVYLEFGRIRFFDMANKRFCTMHPTGRFGTEGLPYRWEACFDPRSGPVNGKVCYMNNNDGSVHWEIPSGHTFVEGVGFMPMEVAKKREEAGVLNGRILTADEMQSLCKDQVLKIYGYKQ